MNLITGHPGGTQVVKQLHKDMSLAHNLEYTEVQSIRWNEIKQNYRGGWVIMRCTNGTAAVRHKGRNSNSFDGYEVVVSDGGEMDSFNSGNSAEVMNFIKSEVGNPTNFFVALDSNQVNNLRDKRRGQKYVHDPLQMQILSTDYLLKKFQPLWARAITAAIADIKGHVITMIKNDAFHKVEKKLGRLNTLQHILTSMDSTTPQLLVNAINTAVLMTASMHYPHATGEIFKSYYRDEYHADSDEGVTMVLDDISNGDKKMMGTVLRFFKRALITV